MGGKDHYNRLDATVTAMPYPSLKPEPTLPKTLMIRH